MCGIAGLLRFDEKPIHQSEIVIMLNKIEHRGYDHAGIALGSKSINANSILSTSIEIGLGHRRLSIIDLNESASQPMYYANNNLCVTYNGEIYNYQELKDYLKKKSYDFTTQSDTEVLLAAYHHWGEKCVHYLNGMFAFALWDDINKQLFCARDPAGIKPFYYKKTPSLFAFSSESIGLVHVDKLSFNIDALLSYLLSMYIVTDESIFLGIKKLPPAHCLTIEMNGNETLERFWSIKHFEENANNEHSIENLEYLIKNSIKQQVHSDVPVGGFLSGGVDSGIITALASPQVKKYHTYSVAYEGLIDNELPYAKKIAERYATEHNEIIISATDAMVNLDLALTKMSEPIADPAIVATYFLSEMAAKDGIKVLLNGTGGDEIFGGYTRYTSQLSFKRKMLDILPQSIKTCLSYFPMNKKIKTRLKCTSLDMILSTGGSYLLARKLLNDKNYFNLFLKNLLHQFNLLSAFRLPLLYQKMLFDMQIYLPNELLFLLDQMTMAHTIEGRVPLLDVNIIQASFNFLAREHVNHNQSKILLKKIAEPYLGTDHIQRKKQGFAGSTSWWVKQHYHQFIEVIAELNTIPYFEDFNIDSYLKITHFNEKNANDIFILYCLCKWYEKIRFRISSWNH